MVAKYVEKVKSYYESHNMRDRIDQLYSTFAAMPRETVRRRLEAWDGRHQAFLRSFPLCVALAGEVDVASVGLADAEPLSDSEEVPEQLELAFGESRADWDRRLGLSRHAGLNREALLRGLRLRRGCFEAALRGFEQTRHDFAAGDRRHSDRFCGLRRHLAVSLQGLQDLRRSALELVCWGFRLTRLAFD